MQSSGAQENLIISLLVFFIMHCFKFIRFVSLLTVIACSKIPFLTKDQTNDGTERESITCGSEYSLEIRSIALKNDSDTSYGMDDIVFPTLGAVKYDNSRSPLNGYGSKSHPIPVGWLYYNRADMRDIYYSFGVPDMPEKIFSWDSSIQGSEKGILFYSVAICPNGDIVCVPRGEMFLNRNNNPIVYKHGDFAHPIEVKALSKNSSGEMVKPVGWFANSGLEVSTEGEFLIFSEYTRPECEPANIWRVSYPYDNPENWSIVYASEGKGEGEREVEHFHSVNYDIFSGNYYAISGDDAYESKIYLSSDMGKSFKSIYGGDGNSGTRIKARAINMIFTQEACYYGSDQGPYLIRVWRSENGNLDFDTVEVVEDKNGNRTIEPRVGYTTGQIYFTCLSDNPYGILMLGYKGGLGPEGIQILFYDIKEDTFSVLTEFETINEKQNGFRCDAVNVYQTILDPRFVVGFGNINNYNELSGNNGSQYMNLTLRIK